MIERREALKAVRRPIPAARPGIKNHSVYPTMIGRNSPGRLVFLATLVGAILVGVPEVNAQTAKVQVIHNSADPAVAWLDFYLGNELVADSMLFRIATEYIDVPAGSGIEAGLAPVGSAGPQDIFKTVPIDLEANKQYVVVINGVLDPTIYKPNPDNRSTALTVHVFETKLDAAADGTSDYLFINGATDAPGLSFIPEDGSELASGVGYGSASEYVSYDQFIYTMRISPSTALSRILAYFYLDVGFLQNQAFTVLTSGFLNRFENRAGPALKLLIVARNGFFRSISVEDLPDDIATMQIINSSSDVDHRNGFDILFDGGRAVNNLLPRSATSTFGVPSGIDLSIFVTDSTGSDVLAGSVITTDAGTHYLVVVSGLVDPSGYAPNPDGRSTNVGIAINPNIKESPDEDGTGAFVFANGITDAPGLDFEITDLPTITDLPFGEMTGYNVVSRFDLLMELFRNDSQLPALVSNLVDIPFALDKAFVVFASGFDDPEANKGGVKAQLLLVLNDGIIVRLDRRQQDRPFSRLQFAHASADPTLQSIDLYADEFIVADDADFRSGTRFYDVFSGKTVTVGIAPANSESFRDITRSWRLKFDDGSVAIAVLRGLLDPGSFAPNPEGRDVGFDLDVIPALDEGPDATQFTVRVVSEITDAPAMDLTVDEMSPPFATGLSFAEQGSYGVIGAKDHGFDFTVAGSSNRIAKSFVEFYRFEGRAGVLFATGFVDSTANGNGPPFSTFLVLDDGTTRVFDRIFTSTESDPPEVPRELILQGAYPNPFRSEAKVVFDLPTAASVSLRVFDATGRLVLRSEPRHIAAGRDRSLLLSAAGLSAGMYFYRITAESESGSHTAHGELMLVR